MKICKRQKHKKFPVKIWTWMLLFFVAVLSHYNAASHFIQIDHNEFRATGFPRPPIPPALPSIDLLTQHLPPKELTPVEIMVDLTNDLSYRILHYHSILNRNNFAFSPTALMSILVALHEGAALRSALELKNVLQFPNNKDILRVGYRDIHRRLRTYFFGSENPLKGLSLNKDNVTITREYETILMFYGYDLCKDMMSSGATTPSTTTTPIEISTRMSPTTTIDSSVTTETTKETSIMLPDKQETTIGSTAENDLTSITFETTTSSTTTTETTEMPKKLTTTETKETQTTEEPTTTAKEGDSDATVASTPVQADIESEVTNGEEAAELISLGTVEPFLRIQKARVTPLPSGRLLAPPRPQSSMRSQTQVRSPIQIQSRPKAHTSMKLTQIPLNASKPESKLKKEYLPATSRSQGRQKRHLLSSFKEADANLFVTLFHSPNQNQYTLSGPGLAPELTQITNEFEVDVKSQYITGPSNKGVDPTETKQNYNTDIISHIFYLGGQEVIYTTYKVYNAVLYFKYFDHLKMSVLELELDTPEYNLMILLPDYHTDLVTAAASLRLGPTLRLLRKQLKPRWVQAIIPDFQLHGTMFLTNDLQNLGICDIFEPNRADFRPMTDEKGIYVKHIEQSIDVNIRTRAINQLRRNYGASQIHPKQISVNHPFLFFVVDRDLDIAVMAGRILNPLNVRIQ